MFNEQNEISGDLRDEYEAIQAADADNTDLLAEAPEADPITPEEEEGHFAEWCRRNGVTIEDMADAQEAIEYEEH